MLLIEDDKLVHVDSASDILEHYGVKGMKWGTRRALKREAKGLYKQVRRLNKDFAKGRIDEATYRKSHSKINKQQNAVAKKAGYSQFDYSLKRGDKMGMRRSSKAAIGWGALSAVLGGSPVSGAIMSKGIDRAYDNHRAKKDVRKAIGNNNIDPYMKNSVRLTKDRSKDGSIRIRKAGK